MSEKISKQQIAAFVDGTLDAAEAARVAEALAQDADAQAYAADVARANRLLREAFDAPMAEPAPAVLRETILQPRRAAAPAGLVDLARASWRRRPAFQMALAASVALVLGAGLGTLLLPQRSQQPAPLAALGPAAEESPLHAALEQLPSGASSDAGVQPMLTFRDAAERICREFEVMGAMPDRLEFGIACRSAQGRWDVEIVVSAPTAAVGPEGYRPASGPGADALDAMLDALGAQPALTATEESDLLRRGWR